MSLSSPQRRLLLRESDIERRRLERQLAAGDPSAGARLLANQIRAGELDSENVALAAALGDPSAKQLGLEEPEYLDRIDFFRLIDSSLQRSNLSHREIVYFAADCAEQVLPVFEREYPNEGRPRRAIEAARSMDRIAARAACDAAGGTCQSTRAAALAAYGACQSARAAALAAWSNVHYIYYTTSAAVHAAEAGLSEDWIIQRLIDYLLGKVN